MEASEGTFEVPPVTVVGHGYCLPYTMELIITKKIKELASAQYDVFDLSGNLVLQADGGVWNLKMKRILRDCAAFPILTMRGKVYVYGVNTWHKWRAYEGEATEENNFKKELNVFLTNNFKKKVADFHVTGCYTSMSY